MKKTIKDIDVKGKKVLLRVDFNVPQNEKGEITDDRRIREALPTINYLLGEGASLVVCSHLGRPKGIDEKYSMKPIAKCFEKLLGRPVILAKDVAGKDSQEKAAKLKAGEVLLLENLRFEAGEEACDAGFSQKLASLANQYVNDAFGTAHRAHASTYGVAEYLPSAVGFLMGKEIEYISGALQNPTRPFVAILGGAKVSDKVKVIENLLNIVDTLIIGGGMAYTFIKARGGSIGNSMLDETKIDLANQIIDKAKAKGVKLLLPIDNGCAQEFKNDAKRKDFASFDIPEGWQGLDIGKKSIHIFNKELKKAKTVIWNGPLGVFEFPRFQKGTQAVAKTLAKIKAARTIIGGGDTAAAVAQFGMESKYSHVSTGGGASLQLMEGTPLPGVDIILEKEAVFKPKTFSKTASAAKAAPAKKTTAKSPAKKTVKK